MEHLTPPPFPNGIKGKTKASHSPEIFEILKQVKVNIPLLDIIKEVPPYVKFLKDLYTIKRGLNIDKKAFLTEKVSSIIEIKTPMKYRDLGCLIISIKIGDSHVEQTLLNLTRC